MAEKEKQTDYAAARAERMKSQERFLKYEPGKETAAERRGLTDREVQGSIERHATPVEDVEGYKE